MHGIYKGYFLGSTPSLAEAVANTPSSLSKCLAATLSTRIQS